MSQLLSLLLHQYGIYFGSQKFLFSCGKKGQRRRIDFKGTYTFLYYTHYQWFIAFKVISKYCSAPILWKVVGGKRVGRKSWKTWWMSLSAGGDDAVPVPVQGMMQHPSFFSFSSSSPLFSFSSVLFKITYSPPPCFAPCQTPCHPLYRPCR